MNIWFGLIFVCLADKRPPPMSDYMGAVDLGGYNLAAAKWACAKTHEIGANWKIVVENNLECYHCPLNHPELMAVRNWKVSSSIEAFANALTDRARGLEVVRSEITCTHTVNGQRICSIPFPRDDNEGNPPACLLLWEPGMAMILSRDHGWIFSPKPLGPNRTELKQYWFVSGGASEGQDYELDRLREFWDLTMQQDRVLCENVQRGMEMHAYRPGPLNRIHQGGQAGFYAWYAEQIRSHIAEEDTDRESSHRRAPE